MWLKIYSLASLFYWLFLTVWLIINGRKIRQLSSIEKLTTLPMPSVIIIVAVRNEEYALREALTSVCHLEYSNYKVLVVNDRSTDGSAAILEELQEKYERLMVINIETLPAGWIGKNHALYTGANFSDEEYILFTDADVLFDKDSLDKAMNYTLQNKLDHLAVLPGLISSSSLLNSVVVTFVIMLTSFTRPWAARNKTSKASIGVGAFNLVRRKAYYRAGTHKAIAMRPDDDLKLAAYLKASGGAADVLYGMNDIKLEWYTSVKEFINGLMKNTFSGFDYNLILAMGAAFGVLISFVLPIPLLVIFGNNQERMIAVAIVLCQVILYGNVPGSNVKWWYAFTSIYAGIIIVYVITKSSLLTLWNGGIYWRDTFYSLAELKKNKKSFM